MTKKFIDVAEFQGDIDWAKAKSEIFGVYIRCGLRGSLAKTNPEYYKKIRKDFKFDRNLKGVQDNNIPYGLYYFPTAITDAEAIDGAAWFYDICRNLNMAYPPMLDVENVWGYYKQNGNTVKEAGRANSLSKERRTELLKIVTDYFNARGMNIGIYASASWFNSKINMSAFPSCVRECTWVADSTGAVDYKGYYWLHQYGQGPCVGIKDDVDLNKVVDIAPSVYIGVKEIIKKTPQDIVLEIAEGEEGYHEGANNHTKYGDEMHALQPSNMDKNAPWCDAWVDWCIYKMCQKFGYGADMARKVLCGDFDDYTYASVNLYKKAGRWTQTPGRAYQIFFGGSGHTGFVRNVAGKRVRTVEGNKGDAVRFCEYSIDDPKIIGYGIPKYELITGDVVETEEEYDMPQLKKGSKGLAVKIWQLIIGAEIDGSFGNETLSKTKEFQKKYGLEIDGIVGPITWKAGLNSVN